MIDTFDNVKEAERRLVTILFGDISGFTSMSEEMDPEEVTTIINDCFNRMGSIIQMNQGTIDKFMGDCVMAIFGSPKAIEHAPQKAINAAIEMRNMIEEYKLKLKHKIQLDIHIGINTGIVVAGMVGSSAKKEFTVMGDTVNVASRLKDISKKGQIFVGQNTYNLTTSDFQYKKLDNINLKGKREQVQVYELLSKKQSVHRPGLNVNRFIQSEMVGRNNELGQLEIHILKVIDGQGGIINIIGEAGIGKSRLIAELQKKHESKGIIILVGRSLSIGKNLSFHPIIDILKNWSGISADDTSLTAYDKLEGSVKRFLPKGYEEVFPFLAKLMGMKLTQKYYDFDNWDRR